VEKQRYLKSRFVPAHARGLIKRIDPRPWQAYAIMPSISTIYVRNPKAASNSIQKYLTDACGAESRKRHEYPLPILAQRRYFTFSFVRNPWERLVSAWLSKICEGYYLGISDEKIDFPELVGRLEHLARTDQFHSVDWHLRPQSRILSICDLDFVGKIESLETDLHALSDRLSIPKVPLMRLHAFRADERYLDLYTDDLIDRVSRLYSSDVEQYGYSFR
jgi:chondroitin 4-sulfotransferase 11